MASCTLLKGFFVFEPKSLSDSPELYASLACYLACESNVSGRVGQESGVEGTLFCFFTLFDLPFLLLSLQRWRNKWIENVCSVGYMSSCLVWA